MDNPILIHGQQTGQTVFGDPRLEKRGSDLYESIRVHQNVVINAAINAIFAHNDAQDLHDLKWEVTINAIKSFTRNQRAIERILGTGKSNPDVERIVGTREEEIDRHHAKHKIQPGHNHRHKRKRTIGEVVRVDG